MSAFYGTTTFTYINTFVNLITENKSLIIYKMDGSHGLEEHLIHKYATLMEQFFKIFVFKLAP